MPPNSTCAHCSAATTADEWFCRRCGGPLASATDAAPVRPRQLEPAPDAPYASFMRRASASAIDLIIVLTLLIVATFATMIVIYAMLGEADGDRLINDRNAGIILAAATAAAWLLYRPLLWRLRDGQSPGQSLVRIRVVRADRQPLSLARGLLRQVIAIAFTLVLWPILSGLDLLWAAWDKAGRQQTLHDKVARTIVVAAPRNAQWPR